MKKTKPLFVILLLLSVSLLLFSCGKADKETDGTEPASETGDCRFTDIFEAKKALVSLMNLPYPVSCYTDESQILYKTVYDKITQALPTLVSVSTAEGYYNELCGVLDSMKIKTDDIPRVYIFTSGQDPGNHYSSAEILVIGKDGTEYTDGIKAQIKLRGNSTRGAAKKPYTLKFDAQVSLLGMELSKKWVLLANAFDKTMLRNKMAFDFARELRFSYSPDCRFVDVYLNDMYCGLYLLTEAVNEGKNRVDIDVGKGDFLLEHESTRTDQGSIYIETGLGMRFKICEPENVSDKQYVEASTYISRTEGSILSGYYELFSEYIDIGSFVDFYLVMELFKDVDGWFSSEYFYIKEGIMYAGPVWDMDLCCGNASMTVDEDKYRTYWNMPGYGTGSGDSADAVWMQTGWFEALMRNDKFMSSVRERYAELQPYIVNLYESNELGPNRIDAIISEYGDAIERNNEIWDVGTAQGEYELEPFDDYKSNVAFYREWLRRRNEFLIAYFG